MGSDRILAVEVDIDDQIIEFCKAHPTLEPQDVVRDIARIVCIANLVRNGTLNGKTMVLCGGMARLTAPPSFLIRTPLGAQAD
jgi:hypothetical protein